MEQKTITASEAKKRAAALRKSLNKRFYFVLISGVIAGSICFGLNSGDFYGFCEMLVTITIFITAVIRFQLKGREVKELEALVVVPD